MNAMNVNVKVLSEYHHQRHLLPLTSDKTNPFVSYLWFFTYDASSLFDVDDTMSNDADGSIDEV